MPWYELTADVMVRGTPRAYGEVLDLSEAEGQLLSGLGRAKPAQPPTKPEAPVVEPPAEPEAVVVEPPTEEEAPVVEPPTEEDSVSTTSAAPAPVKPAVRRRTTSPLTKD